MEQTEIVFPKEVKNEVLQMLQCQKNEIPKKWSTEFSARILREEKEEPEIYPENFSAGKNSREKILRANLRSRNKGS